MNEFVKIQQTNDGAQRVSARELFYRLGYDRSNFARWAKKQITAHPYAIEGTDWVGVVMYDEGNQISDFMLSIDFAKKVCMLSKTVTGEKVRNYFLQVERAALENLSATRQLGSIHPAALEMRVRQLEAKATTTEVQDFTVYGYSRLCGKPVCGNEAQIIGRKAARRCKEARRSIGRVQDPRFGTVNTYPAEILNEVFTDFYSRPRF